MLEFGGYLNGIGYEIFFGVGSVMGKRGVSSISIFDNKELSINSV